MSDHPFDVGDLDVVDEDNHYVWCDEEGEPCGPTHKSFRAAINFITTFDDKYRRITNKIDRIVDNEQYTEQYRSREVGELRSALEKITKTGKRPVELRRLLIRTYVAPLPAKHEAVVAALASVEE